VFAEGCIEGRTEGRAEGRTEGQQQEAAALVLRQLRRRLGAVPTE
jgi:predicted transposase YdaD